MREENEPTELLTLVFGYLAIAPDMISDLRYPIGKYQAPIEFTASARKGFLDRISTLPDRLEETIRGLSDQQLDTPYREGGWTVRQVVHHVADSHLNAYIRVKWTLTEESPTIKAYLEKAWATTPETSADPALSIAILKALHARWTILLSALDEAQLSRQFIHPETGKAVSIDHLISLYAWHGDHHLAHIDQLKTQKNW